MPLSQEQLAWYVQARSYYDQLDDKTLNHLAIDKDFRMSPLYQTIVATHAIFAGEFMVEVEALQQSKPLGCKGHICNDFLDLHYKQQVDSDIAKLVEITTVFRGLGQVINTDENNDILMTAQVCITSPKSSQMLGISFPTNEAILLSANNLINAWKNENYPNLVDVQPFVNESLDDILKFTAALTTLHQNNSLNDNTVHALFDLLHNRQLNDNTLQSLVILNQNNALQSYHNIVGFADKLATYQRETERDISEKSASQLLKLYQASPHSADEFIQMAVGQKQQKNSLEYFCNTLSAVGMMTSIPVGVIAASEELKQMLKEDAILDNTRVIANVKSIQSGLLGMLASNDYIERDKQNVSVFLHGNQEILSSFNISAMPPAHFHNAEANVHTQEHIVTAQ
ncbi:hypothetical protein L3V83_07600 [Thiotrichales bacterium 19X7-9]|nr:hypothetical protein [Thiotrichales bacterium 19X7-9]